MPQVPTTAGMVDSTALGPTLMHEHVAVFSPGAPQAYPFLYNRDRILDACITDLRRLRGAGITTIVDVTTPDLGRDPGLVSEAAKASGVQVVMATGLHLNPPERFHQSSPDAVAEIFVREIDTGIADTSIRAGIIKVASHEEITPPQEIVLRAAARASRATGVAITTHCVPAYRTGLRQIEILAEEGADLSRVVIGHSVTGDLDYLRAVYAAGCTVGWDSYLYYDILPPADRSARTLDLWTLLIEGFAARTVLSHDYAPFIDSIAIPDRDWTYVSSTVIPALRQLGATDEQLDQMLVRNPARLLSRAGQFAVPVAGDPSAA